MKTFLGVASRKGLHVFLCKPWAPFFEVKQRWAQFVFGFSGILPIFSPNQSLWGCACSPTSNNTAFHNCITGNFMVYTRSTWNKFIAAIRAPRKFRMIFYNFCYYFWDRHCWWTETNIIGNDFFIFYKFPFSQLFYFPPCPTAAPPALPLPRRPWICTLFQQTSPKRKHGYDVINSVYPVTMTTIRHCSMLEFGRGHPIKHSGTHPGHHQTSARHCIHSN